MIRFRKRRPFVFDCRDPLGRRVRLDWNQWKYHVLSKRPWMDEFRDALHRVVETPDVITEDAVVPNRHCYYAMGLTDIENELVKIVVEFDESGTGSVITVYPENRVKQGEAEIWPT